MNGTLLGLSGATGVAGFVEAFAGIDFLTGDPLTGDQRFDRGVIGAGAIGGIVLGGVGTSAALSSRAAIAASNSSRFARVLNTSVRTFGIESVLTADLLYLPRALINDLRFAPRRGVAANPFAKGVPLEPGQAGRFSHLDNRAIAGDGLTPHHIPQAALRFTSRAEGGAIVLPQAEHALTRTFLSKGARAVVADKGLPFRTVLLGLLLIF